MTGQRIVCGLRAPHMPTARAAAVVATDSVDSSPE
jgi:hypothetical protein